MRRFLLYVAAVFALLFISTANPTQFVDNMASATNTSVAWQVDLTADSDRGRNVVNGAEGLTLGDEQLSAIAIGADRYYGMLTTPVRTLDWPVTRVKVVLEATVPQGAKVQIDVRGRGVNGSWTEWEPASSSQPAVFGLPSAGIETRIMLLDDGNGNAPVVHKLSMVAEGAHSDTAITPAPRSGPLTYRIHATREGLVGHTTANGHVINPHDRFVALPSFRSLCSRATNPCEYMVELYYPKTGKRTRAPVWDVGPWNTKDDYWNPSWARQMWRDLPQGVPEAEAAYLYGYNGGRDQFGRRVHFPNGIDIADGTFWHDLGMADNDWVEVSFLWTAGQQQVEEMVIDNRRTKRFVASGSWNRAVRNGQRYGSDYSYTTPKMISDPAWFKFNIPESGTYEVAIWYPAAQRYNSATPFIINTPAGPEVVRVDQRIGGGQWNILGTFELAAGDYNVVGVSRWTNTPGYIIADAVRLVRQ